MGLNLYLPKTEDAELNIKIGKKTVKADIFDLEEMLVQATTNAKLATSKWWDEFPKLFIDEYGVKLSKPQVLLLNTAVTEVLLKLKKSLYQESGDSTKQESSPKRKTNKKRT